MATANIALGPWSRPREGGGGGGLMLGNPMEFMNQAMELQTRMQGFSARQRAGQIWSTSKDPLADLSADPLVTGFYPEALTTAREMALSRAQMGEIGARTYGEYQKQSDDALSVYVRNLGVAGLSADPAKALDDASKLALSGVMNPALRGVLSERFKTVNESILDGVDPKNPDRTQLQNNIIGKLVGAGIPLEAAYGTFGRMGPGVVRLPTATGGEGAYPTSVVPGFQPRTGAGGAPAAGAPTAPPAAGAPLAVAPPKYQQEEAGRTTEAYNTMLGNMPRALKLMEGIYAAAKDFPTGGLSEQRLYWGRILEQMRQMNLPVEGVKPDQPAGQILSALATQLNAELVRTMVAGTGAGRLNAEVAPLITNIGPNMDKDALVGVLNKTLEIMQANASQGLEWTRFQKALDNPSSLEATRYGLGGFQSFWNEHVSGTEPIKQGNFNFTRFEPIRPPEHDEGTEAERGGKKYVYHAKPDARGRHWELKE
jgi:hypothetical protein